MNSEKGDVALLKSMRVSEHTPNRIDTPDGAISIAWSTHPAANPYERAERAAAEIVRACNAHDDLVAAANSVLNYSTLDGILADPSRHGNQVFGIRLRDLRALASALAKAESPDAHKASSSAGKGE